MNRFVARVLCVATYTAVALTPLHGARASSGLLLQSIQTAGAASANDESVSLINGSGAAISLNGLLLQYRAANSTSGADCTKGWTTKTTLGTSSLAPGATYTLAAAGFGTADATFTPGLAAAGGTLRVADAAGTALDQLAWGTGLCAVGTAAPAPGKGQLLQRGAGPANSGNNAADFGLGETAASVSRPEPAAPTAASGAGSLELSELLPDPAGPLTDAADEFIELYNAGDQPVSTVGYTVKTGANLATKHSLPVATIMPGAYVSFTSAATHISLANGGSSVALVAPDGTQVGETVSYPAAKAGQVWAKTSTGWSWTSSGTPGAANVLTAVAGAVAAAKTQSIKASKAQVAKVSKTSKAAKTAKAVKAKVAAAPAAVATAATSPGGLWLLFAMVCLTIAYCLYEFRYDMQRIYHRFRGYTPARGETGALVVGRQRLRAGERPGRG